VRFPNLWVSTSLNESNRELLVYAAGGARGAVCKKTWSVGGAASCGSGKEATGLSNITDGAAMNCAGV
jgi:hypothetical protein